MTHYESNQINKLNEDKGEKEWLKYAHMATKIWSRKHFFPEEDLNSKKQHKSIGGTHWKSFKEKEQWFTGAGFWICLGNTLCSYAVWNVDIDVLSF